ncbi:unnamed protein product [Fusarium graminearum]|uniref:Chromosome 3, complete genome n=1 Tax=Gibberella zeae (strain ATCC MYA-4620 / CBS 123657 / FGSC 9075 / NRRL 31084 / PH-1) TaxID=229533 RepID=A0A098DY88_GIBZE|nr:unnamed protein product [Fusarium graminearum]
MCFYTKVSQKSAMVRKDGKELTSQTLAMKMWSNSPREEGQQQPCVVRHGLEGCYYGEGLSPSHNVDEVILWVMAEQQWAEGRARAWRRGREAGERANKLGLEGSRLQLLATKVMHGYLIHGGGCVVVVVLGSTARPTRSPESSHHGIAQQPQCQTKM